MINAKGKIMNPRYLWGKICISTTDKVNAEALCPEGKLFQLCVSSPGTVRISHFPSKKAHGRGALNKTFKT